MRLTFARLPDARVDESFGVLQLAADWLKQHGRKQRIARTSIDTYRSWQSEKANFVVMDGPAIVGLVTLRLEELTEWPGLAGTSAVQTLRALATHPDHRGRGVGALAVRGAIRQCPHGTPIYLDCVSGFLPGYYSQLGFEVVSRQQVTYPDNGETYDVTLMRFSVAS